MAAAAKVTQLSVTAKRLQVWIFSIVVGPTKSLAWWSMGCDKGTAYTCAVLAVVPATVMGTVSS